MLKTPRNIFGAGKNGILTLKLANACNWKVICFIDNDEKLWGLNCENYLVNPPSFIKNFEFDFIIIASESNYESISRQLQKKGLREGLHFFSFKKPVLVDGIEYRINL